MSFLHGGIVVKRITDGKETEFVSAGITFGSDLYGQMWLELQLITGIYVQKDLFQWIDKFIAKATEVYNLPKGNFNKQPLSEKGFKEALKFKNIATGKGGNNGKNRVDTTKAVKGSGRL
jgi:hypothetical protein